MEEYKEAMKEYAAARGGVVTSPLADIHDDEISDEAEAGAVDTDAEATFGEESEEDAPAKAPSPPPKIPSPPAAKTPRANKRQKVGKTNGVIAPIPAPAAAPSPIPVPIPSMVKPTSILPPGSSPAVENPPQPKEKGKKVKGSKEPSPEESKKKRTARKVKGDEETEVAPVESAPPVEKKKRDRKRKSEGTVA
jgi:transcriptional regulator HMO1